MSVMQFYVWYFTIFFFLDLQSVNISLRVLSRPDAAMLPQIYRTLGLDWDERVLPSICNEVRFSFRYFQNSCKMQILYEGLHNSACGYKM
jgi:hypothetical protein